MQEQASIDSYIRQLQQRFRRHMGRYQQIAAITNLNRGLITRLMDEDPHRSNLTVGSLRRLEDALNAYEHELVADIQRDQKRQQKPRLSFVAAN